MTFETYYIFLLTTTIVVFTPGAAAITVSSQGATNGGRKALVGAVGIAAANVVYFLLSATGIASLIIASNAVFMIIKWVGVAYLVWLGTTAIFSKAGAIRIDNKQAQTSARKLFGQGFLIEFANPKALLYFSAVLPQFINTNAPILPQLLIMGVTTLLIDLISYSGYAFLGDLLKRGGLKGWFVSLINKAAGIALFYAAFSMAYVSASK